MERQAPEKYRELISSAYKSLDDPDFSFVEKVLTARPYDPLIRRLRDYAAVEELSSAEDDVCFSYLLKGHSALWKLDLSLVGPFAIFLRLKARVSPDDFLHRDKGDLIAFERKIVDMLHGGKIRLMTVEELQTKVPLALFNTQKDDVRLYQALFSDRKLEIQN